MNLLSTDEAWEEYVYWQETNKTILLTRSADDIPFDLKHYPHIVYNDRLTDLKRNLETRVQWHIANPNKANEDTIPLVLRINDILLNGNTEIAVADNVERWIFLKLDVQNKISRTISLAKFQIGLFAPIDFYYIGKLALTPVALQKWSV